MKATLEEIADYVRGLASPEVAGRIESDPESVESARTLMAVVETAVQEAPEMWVLRAKALLVEQVQTIPLLFGRLVPRAAGPIPGYRSDRESPALLQFKFESANLDISVVEGPNPGELLVTGVFEGHGAALAQVGSESEWLSVTDEDGQFSITLSGGSRVVRVLAADGSRQYQVEVP